MPLELTMICAPYDRARALIEGAVKPEGIDLRVHVDADDVSRHFDGHGGRFDVAEFFTGRYIVDLPFKTLGFTAVPIFVKRMFRHSYIYVNTARRHYRARRPQRQAGGHPELVHHHRPVGPRHSGGGVRRRPEVHHLGGGTASRESPRVVATGMAQARGGGRLRQAAGDAPGRRHRLHDHHRHIGPRGPPAGWTSSFPTTPSASGSTTAGPASSPSSTPC